MNLIKEPILGTNFILHGASFTVSHVALDAVRYSSRAGGRVFSIPFQNFLNLQLEGKIKLEESEERIINQNNSGEIIRRYRYVEAALRLLNRPTAKADLTNHIKKIANDISDFTPPSYRSVARWISKYRSLGMRGLTQQKRRGNTTLRFALEIEFLINDSVNTEYLVREKKSCVDVHSTIVGRASQEGLCDKNLNIVTLPSIRTIQRRVQKIDPYTKSSARLGKAAANNEARSSGQSIHTTSHMSIVEIDSHQLDVQVIDPSCGKIEGRPYLTIAIDVHTRYIVGVYLTMMDPSATTALGALKDMLVRCGIASLIVPDNGCEFANSSFQLLCSTLCMVISPAQRYYPDNKPFVESFFGTLTKAIVQKLPGTTFSNPQERGDYNSDKNACLTLEQVENYVNDWISNVYHKTIHTLTRRAPAIFWEEQEKKMPSIKLNTAEVCALARRPYARTINNGRVQFDHIFYSSHALSTLEAQGKRKVTILVDELDLNTIYVRHESNPEELILANSVQPDYTKDLTLPAHKAAREILNEMKASDRAKLGINAPVIARYHLMQRIHHDSAAAKHRLRKLKNGKDIKSERHISNPIAQIAEIEKSFDPLSSIGSAQKQTTTQKWEQVPKIASFDIGENYA